MRRSCFMERERTFWKIRGKSPGPAFLKSLITLWRIRQIENRKRIRITAQSHHMGKNHYRPPPDHGFHQGDVSHKQGPARNGAPVDWRNEPRYRPVSDWDGPSKFGNDGWDDAF